MNIHLLIFNFKERDFYITIFSSYYNLEVQILQYLAISDLSAFILKNDF